MKPLRICCLALAVAALAAPAASQSANGKLPQLYIDVATHDMAGMPGMGGLGRMAMGMFGKSEVFYGMTRAPGMPGKYMDIALYTGANPAPEAGQAIPPGLQLGKNLPLLPPRPQRDAPADGQGYPGIGDGEAKARILVYWGCGPEVRKGQPREIRIEVKNGKADISGSMPQGRSSPVKAIDAGPEYALWPNERSRKQVPDRASLVGDHQVSGPGVPESMRFALEQAQDFMPKIALSSSGGGDSATTWTWKPVDRATGYFLSAMGQKDDAMVMWSSAEMPEPGSGLMDYLPEATVARWIRERVLLGPQVTSCAVPRGIFGDGIGMTQMIAYGPERHTTWPPKPAKAPASWKPEWALRVRTKSTAFAMSGMAGAGNDGDDGREQEPADPAKPVKSLLKGLFGR